LIEFLERLLAILTSPQGRKACADLQLNPRDMFVELKPAGLTKLQAFLEKRLPRALPYVEP
jgi:hypothetical protein